MNKEGSRLKSLEEMNLIDDFLNNAVASSEPINKEAFRTILETLLGIRIGDISIINQRYITSLDPELKGIRLDVQITEYDSKSKKVRIYDYEPHKKDNVDLPKRNRFYQAKLDSQNMASGDDDYSHMPELYNITITNYDIWGYGYMLYSFSNKCEEVPEINYNDGVHLLYFNTCGTKGGSDSIKNMLSYIGNSNSSAVADAATQNLNSIVEKVRNSKRVRDEYMTIGEMINMETEEALIKERTKVISNMLKYGNTIEQISEMTGYDVEEINKIAVDISSEA